MFRHTVILLILGALYPLALAQGEDASPHPGSDFGYIIVCTLDGEVDEAMAVFVERIAAYAEDAEGVVFIIDTPGGRVDSGLEVTKAIQHVGKFCPTIAYITDGFSASSAGALVAYACKHIVMTSSATIGAAKPIMLTPQGALPGDEKTVSFLRAKFSALAESNGHNPDLAMAMVDEDIELRAFKVGTKVLVKAVNGPSRSTVVQKADAFEKILDYLDRALPLPEELKEAARDLAGETVRDAETEKETATVPLSPADAERYGGPGDAFETYPPEGKLVSASGKLLALTASEAREYGLIPDIFDDLEPVLSFFGLSEYERLEYEMTWSEIIFRWLTNPTVSSLLLLLGIGGIYLELKTPGFGALGIAGITCLVIFFGARAVLGLANWVDIALVVTGLGLILLEIFVIPGFGVTGVAGIVCVVLGIVLSFLLNDWQWPQYQWDYERLTDAAYSLGLAMGLFLVFVAATWKILPRTPLYSRLVLADEQRAEAGFVAQTEQEEEAAIGLRGVATTMLRPAGRGRFGTVTLHVVSRGEFLAPGTPIVVTQVEGNRYVVAPVTREADNAPQEKRSPWISGN